MYKYHVDGTSPKLDSGMIFVFGSNLAGRHGAGAAKAALRYGAKYGYGIGLVGASYAIPTKDENLNVLSIDTIKPYVDRFIKYTHIYCDIEWFVTRVGCGLAGYKDGDIAPLFIGSNSNCSFPESWKPYLE